MHQEGKGNEAEECISVRSLKLLPRQALDEMKASWMKDVEARRICQGTKETGLERSYYRRVFSWNKVVGCPAWSSRLPLLDFRAQLSTTRGRRVEVIRKMELAAVAVVEEGVAPEVRKEIARERSR